MKVLSYLDNVIANDLLLKQIEDKKTRKPPEGLTGSILGDPLQAQVLKVLGVDSVGFDPFVLRKFERGHQVEDWVMRLMPGKLEPKDILELAKKRPAIVGVDDAGQAKIVYRGCTGHVDGIINMEAWEEPGLGVIPHEVKSITNANYNRKFGPRAGGPGANEISWHHKIQIGLYALALGSDTFMVHYIASDDFRIKSYLCGTSDIAGEVHEIITAFDQAMRAGVVPVFSYHEEWQNNKEYQSYPSWSDLSSEEATERLEREYPEAYAKLLSYGKGEI